MSHNNDIDYSQGYGFSYSDSSSTPSPSIPDSPIYYESFWDFQLRRPRKRRRAEEVADYLQDSECENEHGPSCKVRVTELMRVQENARYGLIPAAGRRAVRWTEWFLRALAMLTWEELTMLYRATHRGVEEKIVEYRIAEQRAKQKLPQEQIHGRTPRSQRQYQAMAEDVDEDEDMDMSEDGDQKISSEVTKLEDSNGAVRHSSSSIKSNSNDSSSEAETESDASHGDRFRLSPRPEVVYLPSYLIPARIPSSTANGRRSSITPSTPAVSSNATLHPPVVPRRSELYRPHRPTKNPSDRVIEEILGRPAPLTSAPLITSDTGSTRPSTSSHSTTQTKQPSPPSSQTSSPSPSPPLGQPFLSMLTPGFRLRRANQYTTAQPRSQPSYQSLQARRDNVIQREELSNDDVFEGITLVEYTYRSSHARDAADEEEFFCAGGAGPAGSVVDEGGSVEPRIKGNIFGSI